jgi:hypothetical protein
MRAGSAASAKAQTAPRPNLVALGGGNGHANGANGAALAPPPLAIPAVMVAPVGDIADAPRAGWSSRWPLLVAFVAVIAIVASVALLLFGGGDGKKRDSGVRRNDGPAPEMMQTDPMGPQKIPTAPQPNGAQPPHAGGIPSDPRQPDPVPGVTPPAPPAPPPPSPSGTGPSTARDFFTTAIDVACQRMSSCSADDQVAQYCPMARQTLQQMGTSVDQICPDYDRAAAAECLDAVSRFPCPSGTLDPMAMGDTLLGLSGCQKVCPSAFAGLGGAVGGSLGMTP